MSASTLFVLAYLGFVTALAFSQESRAGTRRFLTGGLLVLLAAALAARFADLLPLFLVPLLLAYLLDPLLDWAERRGLGRVLAVLIVYLAVLGAMLVTGLLLAAPISEQVKQLATQGRQAFEYLTTKVDWDNLEREARLWISSRAPWLKLPDLQGHAKTAALWFFDRAKGFFGWTYTQAAALPWLVLLPISLWYCLIDFDPWRRRLYWLVPPRHRAVVGEMAGAINRALGAYLRGYAFLCLAVGVVDTGALLVMQRAFDFQYGLLLGVLAGATYFIPMVGSFVAVWLGIAVIYFTGGHSLREAFVGLVVLQGINSIFDNVVTPRVVGRETGLHPLLVMFGLILGGKVAGLVGVILATPMLVCLKIVAERLCPRLSEPLPAEEPAEGGAP